MVASTTHSSYIMSQQQQHELTPELLKTSSARLRKRKSREDLKRRLAAGDLDAKKSERDQRVPEKFYERKAV